MSQAGANSSSGGGGGGGLNTLTGNTGTATQSGGNINVIIGDNNGTSTITGAADTLTLTYTDTVNRNTALGDEAMDTFGGIITYTDTIAIGTQAGRGWGFAGGSVSSVAIGSKAASTWGSSTGDVVIGSYAGPNSPNGGTANNVVIGFEVFANQSTGPNDPQNCVVIGASSFLADPPLSQALTDSVAIGYGIANTGGSLTNSVIVGEGCANGVTLSNCVYLGQGLTGFGNESNVTRLGNSSTTSTFVTGINGTTVTGSAVLCATNGLLGTVVSSERYKENISPITNETSAVLDLTPVKFNYKNDEKKDVQYGLIAEEVDKVFPYLCLYDKEGKPESVKYYELATLLLKEIQNLRSRVHELEKNL